MYRILYTAASFSRKLDEPAEAVREPHLLDSSCSWRRENVCLFATAYMAASDALITVWNDKAKRPSHRSQNARRPVEKEARMALARVVSFEGVSKERITEMRQQMNEGQQPDEIPATEIVVLHDADAEKSLAILFFDNEDDYRRADEALNAMPAGDTPGRRTSVEKYDVAMRMTG